MAIKREHLGYIDFIKGVAIIGVILLHIIPKDYLYRIYAHFYIWQSVPLFVFVSFFLIYKKMEQSSIREYFSKASFQKLMHRIIIPYVLLQTVILFFLLAKGNYAAVENVVLIGGAGPGSYCPYLYIQVWIIAPFLFVLLRKNLVLGGAIILFGSIIGNFLFYMSEAPGRLESILLLRYLFLSVVAYIWLINKNNILWTYVLPLISVVYWLYGMNYEMTPWILTSGWWAGHQLPALFYTYFIVSLLYAFYNRYGKVLIAINWFGRKSYEIFLLQLVFFILPIRHYLKFNNVNQEIVVLFLGALLFCSIPLLVLDTVKKHFSLNINNS